MLLIPIRVLLFATVAIPMLGHSVSTQGQGTVTSINSLPVACRASDGLMEGMHRML